MPERRATSARLLARLRAELPPQDIHPDAVPTRERASVADRAAGAWSWFLWPEVKPRVTVGSQHSMAACLRSERWELSTNAHGDITIDPLTNED